MAYERVVDGGSSDVPMHNFDDVKIIEGIFFNKKENVGPNNSMIYELEVSPDKLVGVWGSFILDNKMKKAEPGDKVKIEYTGKKISEKTRRPYKTWEVFIDKAPEETGDIDTSNLPF